MAVSRETLRLTRDLRVTVGTEADDAVRDLTKLWVRAWDTLAREYRPAFADVAALQAELGRWPYAWELARVQRLRRVLTLTEDKLTVLAASTGGTVTDAAGDAITATAAAEPRIMASQLPAGQRVAAAVSFNRLPAAALDAIVARTGERIASTAKPLSRAALDVISRELIRGVAVGAGPRDVARQMLTRTEGAFNGGLTRALNIARTETLDAYRTASKAAHVANRDVLAGWIWWCALDRRSCPACWGMHGTEHPVDEPGPYDHQQGRCARVPKVRPWSDLGISVAEPDSAMPDAETRFAGLSRADQLAVMGPARLELLDSGAASWGDLAVRRDNTGWRTSYVPRPVADLQRSTTAAI